MINKSRSFPARLAAGFCMLKMIYLLKRFPFTEFNTFSKRMNPLDVREGIESELFLFKNAKELWKDAGLYTLLFSFSFYNSFGSD